MRYLILSDLHANIEATQAVIAAANGRYDQIVCCGDLVGYGPDPNAVVEWTRENVNVVVRGNHDKACVGLISGDDFNEVARISAAWTCTQLKPENYEFLLNLPTGPSPVDDAFSILHGSPRDEDEYVPDSRTAAEVMELLPGVVSFFGHTHLQGGFYRDTRNKMVELLPPSRSADMSLRDPAAIRDTSAGLELKPAESYLLNPGSVGQPRDRDPRAAYAIYDTNGRVEFGRTAYDVESAMQKIVGAGLPEFLALRLMMGR